MAELLPWFNTLLVPVVVLLMGIKTDIATLRATQEAHDRRMTLLEKVRA